MKLLTKINRQYDIFSLIILSIGLVLLYLFVNYYFKSETDENLLLTKENVIKNLKIGYKADFAPYITVVELKAGNYKYIDEFKDTIKYNDIEKEEDVYRSLKTICNINNKNYLLIILTDKVEQRDLIFSIGIPLSVILFFLIIISNLAVRRISASIWKPFYNNLEKLRNFSIVENKPLELIDYNIDEFKDLNISLIDLTTKIKSDYKKLKEFSENASHELQTPIAIIKAKIESMLQNENLSKDEITQLQIINKTATRISRINKSLTLLTKLESPEYGEKKEIELKSFINKMLEDFSEIIEAQGITIEIKYLNELILFINQDLLEILLSNLFSNAIKHNIKSGTIILELNESTLIIKNTGKPLVEKPEKMFERFGKGDKFSESPGLGLTIVKEICELNNLEIDYGYSDLLHIIKISIKKIN